MPLTVSSLSSGCPIHRVSILLTHEDIAEKPSSPSIMSRMSKRFIYKIIKVFNKLILNVNNSINKLISEPVLNDSVRKVLDEVSEHNNIPATTCIGCKGHRAQVSGPLLPITF